VYSDTIYSFTPCPDNSYSATSLDFTPADDRATTADFLQFFYWLSFAVLPHPANISQQQDDFAKAWQHRESEIRVIEGPSDSRETADDGVALAHR